MPMLNAMDNDDVSNTREPDYQFYISYDFYGKDNPHFHRKNLYGFHQGKYIYKCIFQKIIYNKYKKLIKL